MNRSEATKIGMDTLKRRGMSTGTAPYGYQVATTGKLVEHHAEQLVLEFVADRAREGWSSRKIATALNQAGFRNRKGGLFRHTQIVRMLRP